MNIIVQSTQSRIDHSERISIYYAYDLDYEYEVDTERQEIHK
jgi:hypothetical protein